MGQDTPSIENLQRTFVRGAPIRPSPGHPSAIACFRSAPSISWGGRSLRMSWYHPLPTPSFSECIEICTSPGNSPEWVVQTVEETDFLLNFILPFCLESRSPTLRQKECLQSLCWDLEVTRTVAVSGRRSVAGETACQWIQLLWHTEAKPDPKAGS